MSKAKLSLLLAAIPSIAALLYWLNVYGNAIYSGWYPLFNDFSLPSWTFYLIAPLIVAIVIAADRAGGIKSMPSIFTKAFYLLLFLINLGLFLYGLWLGYVVFSLSMWAHGTPF